MRVLAVTHQADAGPGVFGEAIRGFGAELVEWTPPSQPPPAGAAEFDALLVLGGSMNADQADRHPWLRAEEALIRAALEAGTPAIGLCLGGQLLAQAAGAPARRAARPEIGWMRIEVDGAGRADPVLGPLAPSFEAFSWHGYEFPLPPGAVALARSALCLQGARIGAAAWALQFHPEVSRADALAWIDDHASDPDALSAGIDPAALRAETEPKIEAFNRLGRDLCRRWLEFAASHR
jgi:GMP synthase (glutamine-hydrolysing)